MSIILKNVSYMYSKGTAFARQSLHNVNFSVDKGEWIVVMGKTGSGKSTLLQHLNGLLRPQKGEVFVDGMNIHISPQTLKEARKKVGLVFQYPEHQIFGATVFEEVAYAPENYGVPVEHIEEIVKKSMQIIGLDYDRYKDRSPHELSGGEKRRVALAGVLAAQPDIIALDEPTAGMDYAGKKQLIRTISELNRNMGITVIWVTHEISELAALADRLVIIDHGKIVMDGEPREILYSNLMQELGLDIPLPVEILRGIWKYKKEKNLDIKTEMRQNPLTIDEFLTEIRRMVR